MVLGKDENFCPVCGNPVRKMREPVHMDNAPVPKTVTPHAVSPTLRHDEQSVSDVQPVKRTKPLNMPTTGYGQPSQPKVTSLLVDQKRSGPHTRGNPPKMRETVQPDSPTRDAPRHRGNRTNTGSEVTLSSSKIPTKTRHVDNSSRTTRRSINEDMQSDSVGAKVEVPSMGGSLKLVIMTQTVITAILGLITSIGLIFTSILFLFSLGERGRYYGLLLIIIFIATVISTVITVFNYSLLRGLKHRDPATRVLAVFYYILLSTPALWGYYLFVLFLIPVVFLSFDKGLADEFSNDGGPVRPRDFRDRSRMRKPFI